MTSNHAMNRMIARCDPAFGVAPYQAMRRAESAVKSVLRKRDLDAFVLIVAQAPVRVKVGRSNGDWLCVLVRNGDIVTVMLRRSGQSRLEGLPHFRVN